MKRTVGGSGVASASSARRTTAFPSDFLEPLESLRRMDLKPAVHPDPPSWVTVVDKRPPVAEIEREDVP